MINTDYSPENRDDYDGSFAISGDDDTAFFNMNMANIEPETNLFQKPQQQSSNFQFGGLNMNTFVKKSDTVVVPNQQVDPSANCNHNCDACMWSAFCHSMKKGLIALGSGGASVPKLG